jgi:GAF domain-containing protein
LSNYLKAVDSQLERDRVRALLSYQVMDSAAEPGFDNLTQLAALGLRADCAGVSLIDSERLWFKARVGFDMAELPCHQALCFHTIQQSEPLVVRDASVDPRFRDRLLVTGPMAMRFYAGVPLVNPEGFRLGCLCIMDSEPRELGDRELELLQLLARQATLQLEARRRSLRDGDRHRSQEREIAVMRDTLDRLNWLEGFVTVCSGCSAIKDESGHWHDLAAYLQRHSNASFSHSICPPCRDELYPELKGKGQGDTGQTAEGPALK